MIFTQLSLSDCLVFSDSDFHFQAGTAAIAFRSRPIKVNVR